jgi:hypothetical protein
MFSRRSLVGLFGAALALIPGACVKPRAIAEAGPGPEDIRRRLWRERKLPRIAVVVAPKETHADGYILLDGVAVMLAKVERWETDQHEDFDLRRDNLIVRFSNAPESFNPPTFGSVDWETLRELTEIETAELSRRVG